MTDSASQPPLEQETREKFKARKGWTHSEETKQLIREKKRLRDLRQEV